MSVMRKSGQSGVVVAILLMVVCGATISRADWAQAESAEFPLDTTIPEPGMLALYCGKC